MEVEDFRVKISQTMETEIEVEEEEDKTRGEEDFSRIRAEVATATTSPSLAPFLNNSPKIKVSRPIKVMANKTSHGEVNRIEVVDIKEGVVDIKAGVVDIEVVGVEDIKMEVGMAKTKTMDTKTETNNNTPPPIQPCKDILHPWLLRKSTKMLYTRTLCFTHPSKKLKPPLKQKTANSQL